MSLDRDKLRQTIIHLQDLSCALPVVRKAIEVIEDPTCNHLQLERIIAADQGLAARVLRLANSAYFGVSTHVSTLSMAVGVIGYRRLQMLLRHVLVAEMLALLKVDPEDARPTRELAVATAAAAHEIARVSWLGNPEELLTVGLLHNIGELALLSLYRDKFLKVRERALQIPREAAEQEIFGARQGEVGRWLLDSWCFPGLYGLGCEHWASPERPVLDDAQRGCLFALHAAVKLARAFLEKSGEDHAYAQVSSAARDRLGMDPLTMAAILGGLSKKLKQVYEVLAA